MEALRRLVSDADAACPGVIGTDSAQLVRLALDRDGRVESVRLATAWHDRSCANALGRAVVETWRDAVHRRLRGWALALSGRPPSPGAVPSAEPTPAAGGLPPRIDEPAVRELGRLVQRAAAALREPNGQDLASAAVPAADDTGHVLVTVQGGCVAGVEFDRWWLRRAPLDAVGDRIREAINAALVAAAPHPAACRTSAVRQIRELTADPAGLNRRLGLA